MDDVAKEIARESLKADLAKAIKLETLAEAALKAGADPKYVAHRYGFTLERCQKFKGEIEKREALKRERQIAVRNGHAPSEAKGSVDAA